MDLAQARVSEAVWDLVPDYVAVVMTIDGLEPGPGTAASEELLAEAEASATTAIGDGQAHDLAEVMRWREAFSSFGVKPRQARSSVESLLRRASAGLPRIDRLTDTYNAISVLHRIPIGGEDLTAYVGPPRLVVAEGTESFDTVADGEHVDEQVPAGEIVWRDDRGVTCRRWNWRQCVRTRLGMGTRSAVFIIDGLGPDAREHAELVGRGLVTKLSVDSPGLSVKTVVLER